MAVNASTVVVSSAATAVTDGVMMATVNSFGSVGADAAKAAAVTDVIVITGG